MSISHLFPTNQPSLDAMVLVSSAAGCCSKMQTPTPPTRRGRLPWTSPKRRCIYHTPPKKTEVCSLHPSHLASSSLAGRTRSDGFSDRTRAAKAPALCRKNVPAASAFGSTSRRQRFFVCYIIGHGEDFSEIRWCTIVEEIGLLTHITSVFEVWCADPVAGPPSIPMKIW